MRFPVITLSIYLGMAAADEGATAWAIHRRLDLTAAEIGLPGRWRIPAKVVVTGTSTALDAGPLRNKRKSRLALRIGVTGLYVFAVGVAVKRGLDDRQK